MIIDLLSSSNYMSYNIQLANIFGLKEAIYLNILLNINSKAIRKNLLTNEYFKLDREYITSVTTFTDVEQKEIEKRLIDAMVLLCDEDGNLKVDTEALTSILLSDDEKLIKDIGKIIKGKSKRKTKDEVILENVKCVFTKIENLELREAYEGWIDSVYAKNKWVSKQIAEAAITVVDNFSNHNLDLALELLQIASINGLRDMNWAVENYNRNHIKNQSNMYKTVQPKVSVGTTIKGVF